MKATADTDRRLQDVADKQEIHEAILAYCRGVDRRDAELVNTAYHPGATDSHFGTDAEGKPKTVPDIGKFFVELVKGREVNRHCVSNVTIRLDGDVADSESYYQALVVKYEGNDAVATRSEGRYIDRFERRDGRWRIARRVLLPEWTETERVPQPAARAGVRSLQSRDDLSYRGLEPLGELSRR